ncbi:helix-turn-helix domain-containing protein [Rhizobacter sp. J219]|jgi:AraC-like DNA-binding protein|uniref:AraC-like ligand-binding domain-containing protein n=1 Tax=Rhizobacter sp. J219 TaxID=2898430 RepID=UPI0021508FAE|nr:helix-turn-helix domain-containing protein [Rhizobacter sp. J219]MCR5884912.1 helix-turn-helix domain-containing protein [Rhizobacter sp. J219]
MQASQMSTDQVAPRERAGFWSDWINRLFCGLKSDLYGDTDFNGRMSTLRAGDVVLTRLESQRHRVLRSPSQVRASEQGYLKIVAPWVGCAGVEQQGREAWVTPDQWSLYDTTDSYAVANPVRVEHLIVMVPKDRVTERGVHIDPLVARRLGGTGGVARIALETMRNAYRELPGMSPQAAQGVGDAITQLVHLSLLDLAGIGTATTQREALRERIKQHVTQHLGDPALSVDAIALALNCSRRQLYNAFAEEPDGVAGYILRRRLEACRRSFDDRAQDRRSITDIAIGFGFSNMAHFSRVFRAHLGVAPSDYRRVAGAARA